MMPTTRVGRYYYFRLRAVLKMRKEREKRFRTSNGGLGSLVPNEHARKPWRYARLGKLLGPSVKPATFAAERPPRLAPHPLIYHLPPCGKGKPPHPHFLQYPLEPVDESWRLKTQGSIGFFDRPVERLGRRVGGLNGRQRQLWAAALCHFLNGYWPDWDVMARHPTETEVMREDDPLDSDPPGSWV